jgi:hypothetical protein
MPRGISRRQALSVGLTVAGAAAATAVVSRTAFAGTDPGPAGLTAAAAPGRA